MKKKLRNELLNLLKTSNVEVTFVKQNGERRTMLATLRQEAYSHYNFASEPVEKEDVCVVWDLGKNSWRSFRFDSVTTIKANFE